MSGDTFFNSFSTERRKLFHTSVYGKRARNYSVPSVYLSADLTVGDFSFIKLILSETSLNKSKFMFKYLNMKRCS